MKNIKREPEDSLRPEYQRSDFGELVRGKFAISQVDFLELTGLLLSCIGEDEGIKFKVRANGNVLPDHRRAEWTYEVDNHNRVILRYWKSSKTNLAENLSNPVAITSAKERKELQTVLKQGVKSLKAKIDLNS